MVFTEERQSESLETPRPMIVGAGFDFVIVIDKMGVVAVTGFYFYFDEWVLLMVDGFC